LIAVVNSVNRSDNTIISIGLHISVTNMTMISHILFSFANSNIYPRMILSFILLLYRDIIVVINYFNLTPLGCVDETVTLSSLSVNLDGAELTLASSVTILTQTVLLLGGSVLLCRDNTAVLVKDQLGFGKATGGLVSGSVPHLGARSFQHLVTLAVNVVLAIMAAIMSFHHFY
jgi:hypothetical protein